MHDPLPDFPPAMFPLEQPPLDAYLQVGGFIPAERLASMLESGLVTRVSSLLTTDDGRRFLVQDGVRVVGRAEGETDPFGLVGVVDTLDSMLRQGFVLSADCVALCSRVYHVEYGIICTPFAGADASGVLPALEEQTLVD